MGKQESLCGTSLSERIIHRPLVLAGFASDHVAPSLSAQIEMMGVGPPGRGSSVSVGEGAMVGSSAPPACAGSQGPMLQFFTKLRRHASLEGASPYFKIKKWKLDSSQRASSLDTRGNGSLSFISVVQSVPMQHGSEANPRGSSSSS